MDRSHVAPLGLHEIAAYTWHESSLILKHVLWLSLLEIWLLDLDASLAFLLLAPVVYLVVIGNNLRVEAGLGCVDHDQLLGPRALLENVRLCCEHMRLLIFAI